jgi:hypothetical protein
VGICTPLSIVTNFGFTFFQTAEEARGRRLFGERKSVEGTWRL